MTYIPLTDYGEAVDRLKHRAPGESHRDACYRVAQGLADDPEHYHAFAEILQAKRFLTGGRIRAGIGTSKATTPYNCFVSGTIADSYVEGEGNIMQRAAEAAQTMRMGGGIGYDFSTLRPRGALIAKLGSSSSGPIPFMRIYDGVCLATSSSGDRRGAQMGILRIDHPDIEEFIHAKNDNHSLRGFNISIAVTDEFMEALASGKPFPLRWGGTTYREIDPQALWETIMRSTHDWAEPGVVFIDTINKWNNLWYCETIAATNPCFSSDTLVFTAEGPKSFKELLGTTSIPVLTQLSNGQLAYRNMTNPRMTRGSQRLMKITFQASNKAKTITTVRCTPNHDFFFTDGGKCDARYLQPGDSISSVYRGKANSKGYFKLRGSYETVLEHHVAAEYNCGRRPDYPLEHAHHVDENKANNHPSNIEILLGAAHNSMNMQQKNAEGKMLHNNRPSYSGDKNPMWRFDLETIPELRAQGASVANIAKRLDCSMYTVRSRLGYERPITNHTVVSVEWTDDVEDVYCGTVEETGKFFIVTGENEGVLVSNCSEQPLPPFGACLLGSLNLTRYLTRAASPCFMWDQLEADIPHIIRAMDNVVDKAKYPLESQRQEAFNKRRMGIGVTGLANTLEAMGYAYGSLDFVAHENLILEAITRHCYRSSALLASEKGCFPLYDDRYLQSQFIRCLDPETQELIRYHGIRNSHLTSIAPTGTISLGADNVSSGIEPVFSYSLQRPIEGLGVVTVEDYGYRFLGTSGKLAADVSVDEHLAVLLTAQRHTDSAVSKTINMDSNKMSWGDFKGIYQRAWEGGAKGVSTFNISGQRSALLTESGAGASCEIDPITGRKNCE